MSDEEYRQEGINMQLKPIKDKLDSIADKLLALEKGFKEIEETIMLNTCRKITEPYCPIRIADLDQIKENKEFLRELSLRTYNLHQAILTNAPLNKLTIGKSLFNIYEKLDIGSARQTEKKGCFNCLHLKDLTCIDRDMNSYKIFQYTTFEMGICDNWIKGRGELSFGEDISAGYKIIEYDPKLREKLPEPKWCDTCEDRLSCAFYTAGEKCTKPKEKAKPEKELYTLHLNGDEFNFKRTTHPFTEYNNMVHRGIGQKLMDYDTEERVRDATRKELIEVFLEKLEFLRDKVLEAPIISGSVQDLRDHTHDIKDLVIKTIKEYEGG